LEDERHTVAIGHGVEDGGADAAESEGEAEEEAGHCAHSAGDELLGVNEDGGEGRGQNEPDDGAQEGAPEEICVGERESEMRNAEVDKVCNRSITPLPKWVPAGRRSELDCFKRSS
jgi:hypothetical protein